MSLNKTTMAADIITALKTINSELTGAAQTAAQGKWELICDAIITRLKADMVVNPGSMQVSGSTFVAPPGTAGGPVSGTSNVTGSGNVT